MSPWVLIGIVAPWFAGMAIVRRPRTGLAGWLLTIGGGWLVGQVLLMCLLYASLRLTGSSHAGGLSLVLVALGIVAMILSRRHRSTATGQGRAAKLPWRRERVGIVWLLAAVFVLSVGAKLIVIVPAQQRVTIRNDDAISMWLFKAKVIADSDHLSFDATDPFYLGGSNPRYPVFLPLSAAYLPLLNGGWNETLAAAPWLGFFLAMPMTILGALRLRLGAWAPALIAAYFVTSLPLVSVHVYRPGYADLPLAAFLSAAICFALTARMEGRRVFAIAMTLLMLVGAAAMKREGPVFAAAVGLVVLLPELWPLVKSEARKPVGLIVGVVLAAVAVLCVIDVRDIWENVRSLEGHGEVLVPLANHAFAWASFDLVFWLLPVAVILVAVTRQAEMRGRAILLAVALLGIDVCIFALTQQYVFAMNDQTPSRLFMQVVPAIVVAMTVPVTTGLIGLADGRPGESENTAH